MAKEKIMLDPGHGEGSAFNRGSKIGNEGDNNYQFSLVLKKKLEAKGFIVGTTRKTSRSNPSLSARGQAAKGYDLFLSLHSNAGNSSTRGVEVFPDTNPVKDWHKLSANLASAISGALNTPNRGVRYWSTKTGYQTGRSSAPKSSNYFGVLRDNLASSYAILLEFCYHTNLTDAKAYVEKREQLADAVANTIAAWYGVKSTSKTEPTSTPDTTKGTPILSAPTTSIKEMQDWAKSKKANQVFVDLAETFYNVSKEYGVNPAVTYAQSAKETGYMNFGGVLNASFCNPCGLKNSAGGGNYDPNAHKKFKNWKEGITAQVQHLGIYAGETYDPKIVVDPRHFPEIRGKAKTVEALGTKWAPSATYGDEIVSMMKQFATVNPPIEIKKEVIETPDKFNVIISLMSERDLDAGRLLSKEYSGLITFSGDVDYAQYRDKDIIAVGGVKGNHTSYAKYLIAGKNAKGTYDEVEKYIKGNDTIKASYKIK